MATSLSNTVSKGKVPLYSSSLRPVAEQKSSAPWLEGWHADVMKSQREARQLTNMDDWWAGGTSLILDLLGGSDPFRPKSSHQELKDEFGGRVTVRIVPDASHAMPFERPEEVANSIGDRADQLKR